SRRLTYSPLPCFSRSCLGIKSSAAELMQYLKPPSSCGPSGKTWPRCESEVSLRTSVRRMPNDVSTCSDTSSSDSERAKLGQPHEESNLSFDVNSGLPLSLST